MKKTLSIISLVLILFAIFFVFIYTLINSNPTFSGSFKTGLTAYNEGDYFKAEQEFIPLAKQGHINAQLYLGKIYLNNRGIEIFDITPKRLKSTWEKLAVQGHAYAQYFLGIVNENVLVNFKTGRYWYERAAEQEYSPAQYSLGAMYEFGEGGPRDLEIALIWYKRAATNGDVNAQSKLGAMYKKGYMVPRNFKIALKWHRLAAKQGHARSLDALGLMYERGEGVKQDYKKALDWFSLAAKKGFNPNFKRITSIKKNLYGLHFWKLLARLGFSEALVNVGTMYFLGEGVPQSYKKAMFWYKQAAEKNYFLGQKSLGKLYEERLGTNESLTKAFIWYSIAASQGDAHSKRKKNMIKKLMTTAQLKMAEKLTYECILKSYKSC